MNEADSSRPSELDLEQERRLERLLRAAFAPTEIDPARHEQLIEAALEDPFAAPSSQELAESERLRQALEGRVDHPNSGLIDALNAAYRPQRLVESAPRLARVAQLRPAQTRGGARRQRLVAVLLPCAAAAVLLLLAAPLLRQSVPNQAPVLADLPLLSLSQSRSTAPLFREDVPSDPSDRIDRIASARARDLRDNRYALWGVR